MAWACLHIDIHIHSERCGLMMMISSRSTTKHMTGLNDHKHTEWCALHYTDTYYSNGA